ncbi:porphobilinogen deaminase [Deltaproteobacteria bacterium]|nr:porphobilinogen deaminase [Deltaproteobacteria bacterium]
MKLGTRKSKLALTQSGMIATALGPDVELVGIESEGDRIVDAPLVGPLAKGFFTEALESALRSGEIDLAVHSLKDLPVENAPGLVVAAIPPREAPNDVLVVRADCWKNGGSLPLAGFAKVGSTSTRRQALLRAWGQTLEIVPLRGNVTTRVERLRQGRFDAIVLAEAGLRRLGAFAPGGEVDLTGLKVFRLDSVAWPCAPGQGALAVQCRADDVATRTRIATLNDPATAAAVTEERQWLARLGGGCSLPFGAWVSGEKWSFMLEQSGSAVLRSGMWLAAAAAALDDVLAGGTGTPTSPQGSPIGVQIHVHA